MHRAPINGLPLEVRYAAGKTILGSLLGAWLKSPYDIANV